MIKQQLLALIDTLNDVKITSLLEQLERETPEIRAAAGTVDSLFNSLAEKLNTSGLEYVKLERIPEKRNHLRFVVSGIYSTKYQDFISESLEVTRLPKDIKSSIVNEHANSHCLTEVIFFQSEPSRDAWLRAEMAYVADENNVVIEIDTSPKRSKESFTFDKGKRLINHLIGYYEDDMPLDVSFVIDGGKEVLDVEGSNSRLVAAAAEPGDASSEAGKEEEGDSRDENKSDSADDADVAPEVGSAESYEKPRNSSTSSQPQRGATTRADEPFVQARVDGKGDIVVAVGKSRPKTKYKDKQGDHVSAYIAFIQFVLNTIEGTPVANIPDLLLNYARCFLPDEKVTSMAEKFKGVHLQAMEGVSNYLAREERKAYTKRLRARGVSKADIDIAKINIKRGYATLVANLITGLVAHILQTINVTEAATFITLGDRDWAEGSRVRIAIEAVSALDKLMALYQTTDEEQKPALRQQLNQDKRLRDGLRKFKTTTSISDDGDEIKTSVHPHIQFIESLINPRLEESDAAAAGPSDSMTAGALSAEIGLLGSRQATSKRSAPVAGSSASASVEMPETFLKQAAQFMLHLFDFNYYRRLSTALLSDPDLFRTTKEIERLLVDNGAHQQFIIAVKIQGEVDLSENERIIANTVTTKSNFRGFVDTLNSGTLKNIIDKEEKDLFLALEKVYSVHMGLMKATFRHLMSEDYFEIIVNNFIDQLQKNSWENSNLFQPFELVQSFGKHRGLSEDASKSGSEDQNNSESETVSRRSRRG